MKLSEAFEKYINNYLIIKGYRERQIGLYRDSSRFLVGYLGDKEIEELTAQDICKWGAYLRSTRRLQQNTLSLYITTIRQVLKWLRMAGNECLNYEMVPVPKRINKVPSFLNKDEVEELINNGAGIRGKLIISMLYSAGLRISELCQLNRGDIVNRQFSVIGKGSKMRLCFIDERTERLLNLYLKSRTDKDKALIITHLGTRITPFSVQSVVKGAVNRANISKRVTPHTLRHSFATNFLENNGNMRYLQALLGHASLSTTQIYTHISDNGLKTAYMNFHTI